MCRENILVSATTRPGEAARPHSGAETALMKRTCGPQLRATPACARPVIYAVAYIVLIGALSHNIDHLVITITDVYAYNPM